MRDILIPFTDEMVNAILGGRKTETRRVIWGKPHRKILDWIIDHPGLPIPDEFLSLCPYGQAGEQLWGRENWRILDDVTLLDAEVRVEYQADGGIIKYRFGDICYNEYGKDLPVVHSAMSDGKVKPAMHMPKILSRLPLVNNGVKIEKLHDIDEAGAKAEGVRAALVGIIDDVRKQSHQDTSEATYRKGYSMAWHRINKGRGYGWDTNPLVWVVKFYSSRSVMKAV